MKYFLVCLILWGQPLFAAVKKPKQELVTIAVGKIQNKIVTSRQVNMSYFVESILYGRKGLKAPTQFYPVNSKEFAREVKAVLLEKVVYRDSLGFKAMSVSEQEINTAYNKFLKIAKKHKVWLDLQVSSVELKGLISHKLRSKKYIRFKVDSSVVPITDDEARQYFELNRVKFGNLPFENFKQNIRAFLGRQQINRRLKDWFEVLQNKYRVKNLLSEVS